MIVHARVVAPLAWVLGMSHRANTVLGDQGRFVNAR